MITFNTLSFLKDLSKNNNREWFHANKKDYEIAKQEFTNYVEQLITKLKVFDETLAGVEAKKCIFRINRDIRFSKDKRPYKENFGAFISFEGKKTRYAGYYFHVDSKQCIIAGGLYMPPPEELKIIRQFISNQQKDFLSIINNNTFVKEYGGIEMTKEYSLVRPPKGFQDANNDIMPYIKLKSFTFGKSIKDYTNNKHLLSETIRLLKIGMPFIHFINAGLIKNR